MEDPDECPDCGGKQSCTCSVIVINERNKMKFKMEEIKAMNKDREDRIRKALRIARLIYGSFTIAQVLIIGNVWVEGDEGILLKLGISVLVLCLIVLATIGWKSIEKNIIEKGGFEL